MVRQAEREDTSGSALTDLYATFERLRRRYVRLTRMMRRKRVDADALKRQSRGRLAMHVALDRVGYHAAWSAWSESYDDVADAAARLIGSRPRSLPELVLIFHALEWLLLTDGVIVDRVAERQVRAFRRHLRQLATARP